MSNTNEVSNRRKYEIVQHMLDSEFVLVHLDPSVTGVDIPAHLRESGTVTLKLSRLFRGSLEVDPDWIQAELLFGSDYYKCRLPFTAIWGATSSSGKNSVWPESAPEAVLKEIMKAGGKPARATAVESEPGNTPPRRPQLRRVK